MGTKLEDSINLYAEGNHLFEEANKIFDEADELSVQEEKMSEEVDRIDAEDDNLREEQNALYQKYNLSVDSEEDGSSLLKEADEIDTKLFQLASDLIKLRRSSREIGLKNSLLRIQASVLSKNASTLHAESRKLWLEGMIEFSKEMV